MWTFELSRLRKIRLKFHPSVGVSLPGKHGVTELTRGAVVHMSILDDMDMLGCRVVMLGSVF